ncbi:isoprenyl transferase, partial [Clostridium perfringens]
SNFMLWQTAYSELWFTDLYWPEFGREQLFAAVAEYQRRTRRYGGLS